jgi:hypothetical protein
MPQCRMHIQAAMSLIAMQIQGHPGDGDMHEDGSDEKIRPDGHVEKAMDE